MAKTITSRPNIFGGTSHYDEHGKKIGESRPAIFGGNNHYDAKGHKIGYSRPGILSDDVQVHYDTHHNKVGTSRVGISAPGSRARAAWCSATNRIAPMTPGSSTRSISAKSSVGGVSGASLCLSSASPISACTRLRRISP